MRVLVLLPILLVACTEMPMCPPVDERRIGADAEGPDGFSANEVLDRVGTERVYEVGTWRDAFLPTGVDGVVTVEIEGRNGRPWVREWTCVPPTLYVPVDVRVTSDDGTLAIEGRMEIGAKALTDDAVFFVVDSADPLGGVVPEDLVAAAAVEQGDHCAEDADEQPTVRVFLGGSLDDARLDFDAQYRRHRVCNYAASLASARLSPR